MLSVLTVHFFYKFLSCLQDLLSVANEHWGKKQHFLYLRL